MIQQQITEQDVWKALEDVFDPEIPKLSVVDLGVITAVRVDEHNAAHVTMTPTFSGCPAVEMMRSDVAERLKQLPLSRVTVDVSFEVPWDSNRISERGREVLQQSGFAPPPKHEGFIELQVLSNVACPYCGSRNTRLQSPFGPTLCRSIHYCDNCFQAFEQFKPVA
jgi:ring-1,2-phenylacetyl-CoA epoxidase subunit PaaD